VSDLQDRIMRMGRLARGMLKDSLDALISLDVRKAVEVIGRDGEVDQLNVEVITGVIARATPENTGAMTESLILIHSVARDLERIGDHATNIAEDVAYLVDGTIIRHKHTQPT
jgi:phosphate transport system protein